jgi:coenzyme F420-dependent glucose-6-phosphate dehydrogenase
LKNRRTPTRKQRKKTMVALGYALSSEELPPNDLVRYAQRAEAVGFTFAMISDHYHPWIDRQGHSAFVWSVIGAIAHNTTQLRLATGVTCPIMRLHPAIIAQAAATAAAMMPGRFALGVGTGENLNEHILGERWPPHAVRLAMLEEAVQVIRLLWQGGTQTHRGRYYTVENARLYTLPETLPPILVAASGPQAAAAAGRIGEGLVTTREQEDILAQFDAAGGRGKPRYIQFSACWAPDDASALRTAYEYWPNAGLPGELSQELPTPAYFEQAVQLVRAEDIGQVIVCGPDPAKHLEKIHRLTEAGYDHIYVHQVGPDQEGFLRFYEHDILPKVR